MLLLCGHFQQLDLELNLAFGTRSLLDLVFVSSALMCDALQAVLHLMKMYGPFIAWQLGLMLFIYFLCNVPVGWPAGNRNVYLQYMTHLAYMLTW